MNDINLTLNFCILLKKHDLILTVSDLLEIRMEINDILSRKTNALSITPAQTVDKEARRLSILGSTDPIQQQAFIDNLMDRALNKINLGNASKDNMKDAAEQVKKSCIDEIATSVTRSGELAMLEEDIAKASRICLSASQLVDSLLIARFCLLARSIANSVCFRASCSRFIHNSQHSPQLIRH